MVTSRSIMDLNVSQKRRATWNNPISPGLCAIMLIVSFQDAKLSQVANSIRVVALALQAMYNDRCAENSSVCTETFALNGTLLYKYMLNVTFVDQFNQEMYFDANGDPPPWSVTIY